MNDLETLENAKRWIIDASQTTASDDPLIFLIGSKQDLIVGEILAFGMNVIQGRCLDGREELCEN